MPLPAKKIFRCYICQGESEPEFENESPLHWFAIGFRTDVDRNAKNRRGGLCCSAVCLCRRAQQLVERERHLANKAAQERVLEATALLFAEEAALNDANML
jgi:hypothetical protein